MKKFLLSFLFFLFTCASVWGAITPSIEGTTLTLSGSGAMSSYGSTSNKSPWNGNTTITKIVVGSGITRIGANAFYGMTALTTIELPASLDSIATDAFKGCTATKSIKYASSPTNWAQVGIASAYAHPFGENGGSVTTATKNARAYYFYGNASSTSILVFEPGLTRIKPYTFCNANNTLTSCNIPGSVAKIGIYALNSEFSEVVVNRTTRPKCEGNSSVTFTDSGILYVPSGSKSSYDDKASDYWKDAMSYNNKGYSDIKEKALSGDCTMSSGSASWTLNTNGVLTITGHGVIADYAGSANYQWTYFRRLVHKAVIQNDEYGDLTSVGNALKWNWGISEVTINQTSIPTANILGGNSESYADLFNSRDNVVLKIKSASLADASASNLASDPWDNARLDIQLSDNLEIGDGANYSTILTNCSTYVEKPVTMQINRELANGIYNTFCSPVAISAAKIKEIWGNDTKLYEMSTSAGSGEENEVVMNFDDATEGIAAGVPYLIKPTNSDVTSFTIEGIAPSSVVSEPEEVSNTEITFHGTLAPREVTEDEITNKSFIILTGTVTEDGQLLTYANGGTLGGMRAYWIMDTPAGAPMRRPVLRIGQSTTAFETVSDEQLALNGKKILRNGQLFIVRGEKMYNMQGQLIK